MQFLYPNMLWGLLAILIPIAIHLFNFRKHKQVFFSNTALLRNIERENAKTRKLKYFVTLCLRCCFVISVVLAFAFPYRNDKQLNTNDESNLLGVYLDNSMSMKCQSERTTIFEDARQSARDLVRKFNPSTRFVLMSNCFEVQNEYPMNQDEMLNRIDRMDPEGGPVAMGDVLDRFSMLCKQYGANASSLFVYSDFQKNTFDLSSSKADSAMQLLLVPMVSSFSSNIYVDSVWLTSPILQIGLPNTLNVKVVNEGSKDVKSLPVSFSINGSRVASAATDVEKTNFSVLEMQFVVEQSGEQLCVVSLLDSPVTFDDDYYFVMDVKPSINVVELGLESTDCELLFAGDDQFDYVQMNPDRFDLDLLHEAQLIIVNETANLNTSLQQTLVDCANEGSSLLVFPSVDGSDRNDLLYEAAAVGRGEIDANPTKVESMASQHDFFVDMLVELPEHAELPVAFRHVQLKPNGLSTSLLGFQNSDPFLVAVPKGKGNVFVAATALDGAWSDLSDNALFVPMMLKMALIGAKVGKLSYTIGVDNRLSVKDVPTVGDGSFSMCDEDRTFVLRPTVELRNHVANLFLDDDFPPAGFCKLLLNDTLNRTLAWNDSRLESSMEFAPREDIERLFADSGFEVAAILDVADFASNDLVDAMARQSSVWKCFVIIALLALLGEIAVLRFWK